MLTFSLNPAVDIGRFLKQYKEPTNDLARQYLGDYIVRATEKICGQARANTVAQSYDTTYLAQYAFSAEGFANQRKCAREIPIVTTDAALSDELDKGYACTLLSYVEHHFDDVLDNSEFAATLQEFFGVRDYIMFEEGLDIAIVFVQALNGVKRHVERLKQLAEEYSLFNMLQVMCSRDGLREYLLENI